MGRNGLALGMLVLAFTLLRAWRLDFPGEVYFDEFHYARSAQDYLLGLRDTNWAHPPLAKMQMSMFLRLFGNEIWFCRLNSLLMGSCSLLATAVLALQLTGRWRVAFLAVVLLGTDLLSFTQSRIAMLDASLAFWCLGGFCLALRAIGTGRSRFSCELGAGLCFGCATACKWSGLFAAASVLLFYWWERQSWRQLLRTSLVYLGCIVVIYASCHLPFLVRDVGALSYLADCHRSMFSFRSGANSVHLKHPFVSQFYTWPLAWRPVYLYLKNPDFEHTSSIICGGSPLFWWMALLLLGDEIWLRKKRDRATKFLVVNILVQWLVWSVAAKTGMLFYLLPCIPAFAILVGREVDEWLDASPVERNLAALYLASVVAFFVVYFPTVSALPVPSRCWKVLYSPPSWQWIRTRDG